MKNDTSPRPLLSQGRGFSRCPSDALEHTLSGAHVFFAVPKRPAALVHRVLVLSLYDAIVLSPSPHLETAPPSVVFSASCDAYFVTKRTQARGGHHLILLADSCFCEIRPLLISSFNPFFQIASSDLAFRPGPPRNPTPVEAFPEKAFLSSALMLMSSSIDPQVGLV